MRFRVALVGVALLGLVYFGWTQLQLLREWEAEDVRMVEEAGATLGSWDDTDWEAFESKVRWAAAEGVDTLSVGRAMVELGRSFVGTPYVPQTLEAEGPERLVIDFGGLDCVTLVENVLAMARFIRASGVELLSDRAVSEDRYESLLAEVRYRDGSIDGYPSRLHYFSDWVADNTRRGLIDDVSDDLGGILDTEPIDFMTTHAEAYRQLAEPEHVALVREAEVRLTAVGRHFVPEGRIAEVAHRISDGDIIAATSTVSGLDVAHTGLALWLDGALHLLHAPLVGDSVQISEVPLADRILRIEGQDGILVARPLEG